MKKLAILFLILALIAMPVISGTTLAYADEGKIMVTGEGEITLIPDMAIISVGVESLNESLINAQTENTENVNSLIAILKELGINEENIKTKGYNVYQRYDYTQGEKLLGYQVSNYLEFKTKNVDNVGQIISKLMENGANRFSGITFTLENSEEAYKQALKKAYENAKNKANALYDGELKVVKIIEEKNNTYYLRDSYGYASSINEATKFMKGEIKVFASLKVVFEYDNSLSIDQSTPNTDSDNLKDQVDKETGENDNNTNNEEVFENFIKNLNLEEIA